MAIGTIIQQTFVKRALWLGLGWLGIIAPTWAQHTFSPLPKSMYRDLSRILQVETAIDPKHRPEIQMVLIDGDSLWIAHFEATGRQHTSSADSATVYEVGALSMLPTAALACLAAKKGLLSLDSSINHYLPDSFRLEWLAPYSLRQLLTHQVGLARQPDMKGTLNQPDQSPFAQYSWSDLLAWLKQLPEPRDAAAYSFSYVHYALVQLILEHLTSQPIEQLFDAWIGQVAGLYESGYQWTKNMWTQMAIPHNRGGRTVAPWKFSSFEGALAFKTSPRDMATLIRWLLQEPSCQPLFDPYTAVPYRKGVWATAGGHATFPRKHIKVVAQSGATDGHSAYIAIAPDYQKAIIVFADTAIGLGKFGYLSLRYLMRGWHVKKLRDAR